MYSYSHCKFEYIESTTRWVDTHIHTLVHVKSFYAHMLKTKSIIFQSIHVLYTFIVTFKVRWKDMTSLKVNNRRMFDKRRFLKPSLHLGKVEDSDAAAVGCILLAWSERRRWRELLVDVHLWLRVVTVTRAADALIENKRKKYPTLERLNSRTIIEMFAKRKTFKQ